ncbi:alpha/beta fold hydrolase [Pseudonocardia sp. ICBG1293]|uniref:alpha/beta fold hydrolase n=1 Tax=Pseudonocardia sp. ICBG1293 TaxID=2844382 RepID=UPI0015BF54AD|nr:alpha/beta hydrolase [Pseudonocardia sp. ICBG1293]NWJ69696.1 alpha/beta hydrolase [Pseudonocardia pini]
MRILLVHGAGGTPATWDAVLPELRRRGHAVSTVTNPMTSLTDDVAHTTAALDALEAPVLLVGHSYGGAVITNVGRDPRVAGLVYVAAFAPDAGETVQQIVERYDPAPVSAHMQRGPDGEWRSERGAAYWAEIGWDLSPELRAGRIAENRVADRKIFEEPTGEPAWRTLPSWYQVADGDATLLPQIQRDMATRAGATTSSVPGSHFSPLVHADEVCALIDTAVAELTGVRSGP